MAKTSCEDSEAQRPKRGLVPDAEGEKEPGPGPSRSHPRATSHLRYRWPQRMSHAPADSQGNDPQHAKGGAQALSRTCK